MINIYVVCWLDRNFGDDLMFIKFAEAVKGKCNFYINTRSELVSYYTALFEKHEHVKLTDKTKFQIHKLDKDFFSYIVMLGGSTLMGRSLGEAFAYVRRLCSLKWIKWRSGTGYMIIGCNTGPFKNRVTEWIVKQDIKHAELITTRDQASYEFLIKTTNSKVFYYPDILMNLSADMGILRQKIEPKCLGVSVYYSMSDDAISFIAKVCSLWISNAKGIVRLFCFSLETQNDRLAAEKIKALVEGSVEIINHDLYPSAFLSAIAECERIIAIRFHAAIMAISLDIPFIPICYSNKMENLLQDIGQSEYTYRLEDLKDTDPQTFYYRLVGEPILPSPEWANLKKDAKGHFDEAVKLLSNF